LTNSAIIAELGGYLKARIKLSDINHAEKNGTLQKDVVYIGFVEDIIRLSIDETSSYINEKGEKCVLREVRVIVHDDDGLVVHADSIESSHEWYTGDQVFSRVAVATQVL
jgi:hypothetical protein